MMQVLISQIRHNHNNLAVIEDVLMRFKIHSQVENILTWTAFSWVDKDFKLTADMLYGIMKKPIDMSDRQYVHLTKQEPDEVHFGKPIYGSTSKVWMIPAGIGVTDNKKNYIGSIVIGFGIAALLEKLKTAAINEGIDFALIDKNLEVILQSKADLKGIDKKGNIESVLRTKLLETVNFSSPLPLVLSNINLKKTDENYYLYKINKYPFLLYLTYDKRLVDEKLWQGLIFRIIEIISVGLTVLVLLILLYRQIVRPMVVLSKIVDEIPKGIYKTKAPRSWTYEITNLTKQMLKLKRILSHEKREKENLLTTAQIVTISDSAKEAFSQQIIASTREPMQVIRYSVELLIADLSGNLGRKLSFEEKCTLLQEAYKASFNILERTDDVLSLELIDIKKLLNECAIIHAKAAHKYRMSICLSIEDDIPELLADKLKLKQVIVALIKRSINFSPKNSSINIQANVVQELGKITHLQIIIRDNGFGLNNNEREKIIKNVGKEDVDYDYLKADVITKLVNLHKGTINIEDTQGTGSIIQILLPYLDQEEVAYEEIELSDNVIPLFNKKISIKIKDKFESNKIE